MAGIMQGAMPSIAGIFFQANTIKGYEAWDKAGLIANNLSDRFQTISYGPLGLVCAQPSDAADALLEVRVDPTMIHLTYRPETPWEEVVRQSAKRAEWIARAISVSTFSRIGLRVYLVWPTTSKDEAVQVVRKHTFERSDIKWQSLGTVGTAEVRITADADALQLRLTVQAAERAQLGASNGSRDPGIAVASQHEAFPAQGLLFDADIYTVRSTAYVDVQSQLRRFIDYITGRVIPLGQSMMEAAP